MKRFYSLKSSVKGRRMTFTASDCDLACLSLIQDAFHVVSQQPEEGLTRSKLELKT